MEPISRTLVVNRDGALHESTITFELHRREGETLCTISCEQFTPGQVTLSGEDDVQALLLAFRFATSMIELQKQKGLHIWWLTPNNLGGFPT